jgi:hypothetical protein
LNEELLPAPPLVAVMENADELLPLEFIAPPLPTVIGNVPAPTLELVPDK